MTHTPCYRAFLFLVKFQDAEVQIRFSRRNKISVSVQRYEKQKNKVAEIQLIDRPRKSPAEENSDEF